MNIYKQAVTCILLSGILFACKTESTKISKAELTDYKMLKSSEKIVVDGKMDEKVWADAVVVSLDNFYEIKKDSDRQNTKFRMLWDDENLYLFYEAEDKFITARATEQDGQPYMDDCAEIFITPTPTANKTHFAFEVNLYKTSNDIVYIEDYYKGQKGVIKGFNPDFERAVVVDGTINDNSDIDKGWTMEMAIPLVSFWGMDWYHPAELGTKWTFQVLRQGRNEVEGERRVVSTLFPISDLEDVHNSKRFGVLEFANEK